MSISSSELFIYRSRSLNSPKKKKKRGVAPLSSLISPNTRSRPALRPQLVRFESRMYLLQPPTGSKPPPHEADAHVPSALTLLFPIIIAGMESCPEGILPVCPADTSGTENLNDMNVMCF